MLKLVFATPPTQFATEKTQLSYQFMNPNCHRRLLYSTILATDHCELRVLVSAHQVLIRWSSFISFCTRKSLGRIASPPAANCSLSFILFSSVLSLVVVTAGSLSTIPGYTPAHATWNFVVACILLWWLSFWAIIPPLNLVIAGGIARYAHNSQELQDDGTGIQWQLVPSQKARQNLNKKIVMLLEEGEGTLLMR